MQESKEKRNQRDQFQWQKERKNECIEQKTKQNKNRTLMQINAEMMGFSPFQDSLNVANRQLEVETSRFFEKF